MIRKDIGIIRIQAGLLGAFSEKPFRIIHDKLVQGG